MRAVVLVEDGCLQVMERRDFAPMADECVILIHACGVCSSDIPRAFARGAYFYPLVMGHEFAGTVEACGSQVLGFRQGDRVTVFPLLPCFQCGACARQVYAQCQDYSYYGSRRDGAFTDRLAVKSWNLLKLPDDLCLDDAALVEPTAVVMHALRRLGLVDAEADGKLCVIGAGFLGLIAVEALRGLYPKVKTTVLDRNKWKLERAALLGATTVELQSEAEWEEYVAANNAAFPLVLEAAGAPLTFAFSLKLASPSGRVAWMGNISGSFTLPQKDTSSILRKELTIVGCWNSEYRGESPSDWTRTLEAMTRGLKPSALVDVEVGLNELPDALARLNAHKRRTAEAQFLKILLRPNK